VVYTDTHDNNTTRGLVVRASAMRQVLDYLGTGDGHDIHWQSVRAASAS
jgi:4-alpha-glucanotransferase